MEENWIDVTSECPIRWRHLKGQGSVVEVLHNERVIALLSPDGGNLTVSPQVRGYYKIEVGESDIPAKWFRIFHLPQEDC